MNTPDNNETSPVLVLGGTGKTGRRVAQRLDSRDVPARIGSRAASPPFDWEDDSTWPAALEGVRAAYVVYYPDLTIKGAAEAVEAFAALAVIGGVEQLVLLSGRGEEGARRCEQAVQDAGAAWTIVRSSWFCQNFSEGYLLDAVLEGAIVLPAGDVAEPFIDVDDIADVVVAALTERRHSGRIYDVTGPRLLTFAQAATEIADASGRDVVYVPVSSEEYAAGAEASGVPAELVDLMTALFAEVLDGRNAYLSDGVEQALGRPARDFTEYARAAARSGVWTR